MKLAPDLNNFFKHESGSVIQMKLSRKNAAPNGTCSRLIHSPTVTTAPAPADKMTNVHRTCSCSDDPSGGERARPVGSGEPGHNEALSEDRGWSYTSFAAAGRLNQGVSGAVFILVAGPLPSGRLNEHIAAARSPPDALALSERQHVRRGTPGRASRSA